MARKNENSVAERLSAPSSNAPTMVAPERETPGIMARHWQRPIGKRQRQRIVHDVVIARLEPHPVDGQQHDAADDQRRADEPGRFEQDGLDELVRGGADHGRRQEGHQHGQHEVARARIARQVEQAAAAAWPT